MVLVRVRFKVSAFQRSSRSSSHFQTLDLLTRLSSCISTLARELTHASLVDRSDALETLKWALSLTVEWLTKEPTSSIFAQWLHDKECQPLAGSLWSMIASESLQIRLSAWPTNSVTLTTTCLVQSRSHPALDTLTDLLLWLAREVEETKSLPLLIKPLRKETPAFTLSERLNLCNLLQFTIT